jgi:Putative DNA-binding domain
MRWEPITPANAADKLAGSHEHGLLDFKLTYDLTDKTKRYEIAKDVSAFANHFGGSIVVGAKEQRGRIAFFQDVANAGDLVKEIGTAIKLACLPVPIADANVIRFEADQVEVILGRPSPATSIVVINVPAALNAPIGCLDCSDACKACKASGVTCSCEGVAIADAWRFPVRLIEGTRFLRPDEIARVMNAAERRALLDLQPLVGTEIFVWFNGGGTLLTMARKCILRKLEPEISVCVLGTVGGEKYGETEIPLAFVRATWRSGKGWNVAIDGSAFGPDGRLGYTGFAPQGSLS